MLEIFYLKVLKLKALTKETLVNDIPVLQADLYPVSTFILLVHVFSTCDLESSWGAVTCTYYSLFLFYFKSPSPLIPSPILLFLLLILPCYGAQCSHPLRFSGSCTRHILILLMFPSLLLSSHTPYLDHFPTARDSSPYRILSILYCALCLYFASFK